MDIPKVSRTVKMTGFPLFIFMGGDSEQWALGKPVPSHRRVHLKGRVGVLMNGSE